MRRALLLSFLLFGGLGLSFGCAGLEENPPKPLPEDVGPMPYPDLLRRARQQAQAANEAFYTNRWDDLESAARGLEQTARFLAKSTEVPARQKDRVSQVAGELGQEATALRAAAKERQVNKTNDALQKIHLKVRDLRAEG